MSHGRKSGPKKSDQIAGDLAQKLGHFGGELLMLSKNSITLGGTIYQENSSGLSEYDKPLRHHNFLGEKLCHFSMILRGGVKLAPPLKKTLQ